MKTIKKILIPLIGFIVGYLLASFYSVSFDIAEWGEPVRFVLVFSWVCFVILFFIIKEE